MKKSFLLLASFVGFVACNQEKKEEAAAQTTEEVCPAEAPTAPATETPAAAPAEHGNEHKAQ